MRRDRPEVLSSIIKYEAIHVVVNLDRLDLLHWHAPHNNFRVCLNHATFLSDFNLATLQNCVVTLRVHELLVAERNGTIEPFRRGDYVRRVKHISSLLQLLQLALHEHLAGLFVVRLET